MASGPSMTTAPIPEQFQREMGCLAAELGAWLPRIAGERPLHLEDGGARIGLGGGHLRLDWQTLPPRRIALLSLPRLDVRFRFEAVPADERGHFMQRFDLYTQRGGG